MVPGAAASGRLGSYSHQMSLVMKIPDWKKSYRDALSERDQSKVGTRIVTAQLTMHERLRDLKRDGSDIEERKAVDVALSNVEAYQRCLNCNAK
jgi:hypothetical protein